jgi:hypothetical protein
MRRAVASLTLASLVAMSIGAGGTLAAGPPVNDDLAAAQAVDVVSFTDTPDMTGATLETDELTCDETGGSLTQSIWYSIDIPTRASVRIEIYGEPFHHVTAGVFGPFGTLPTAAGGLEPIHCIYDTGLESALTEVYSPGTYLVQLTTAPDATSIAIQIEELNVIVVPWQAGFTEPLTVPQGVGISVEWGWLACSKGMAKQVRDAVAQSYLLRMGEGEVTGLSARDAIDLWWGPEPADPPGGCLAPSPAHVMRWGWYIEPLGPGDYELDVEMVVTRMIHDGTVDGDGRLVMLPPGTVIGEGTISITVPEN